MKVAWVMKVEWVMKVAQVVGVVWDGDEMIHTEQEVQHHAFLLHLCGCIVIHQSEKPPPNEASNTPYSTKHVSSTLPLTCGADHSLLLSPWFPKPLVAYYSV